LLHYDARAAQLRRIHNGIYILKVRTEHSRDLAGDLL